MSGVADCAIIFSAAELFSFLLDFAKLGDAEAEFLLAIQVAVLSSDDS